jgi:hypothetical protein
MVPDHTKFSTSDWLYGLLYQTGAYVEPEMDSGC